MIIFKEKNKLQNHLKTGINGIKTIGFVPTMGALHNGHLSLIKKSLASNDLTVVSIFVNPTQFNNLEDLEKYPRTLECDIKKIESISNEIIIYHPSEVDIYDNMILSDKFNFGKIAKKMEGKFRPGHFDGVGTVVEKLFQAVQPTNAYFGEKDFQQLLIIKKLVEIKKINVNIIPCEIYREPNGLAMSSRNERLSIEERYQAKIIYETLLQVKEKFDSKSVKTINEWVVKQFDKQTLFSLEYFEITDETTLESVKRKVKNKKYRAFIAVFVNNIRLIDNISLN